MAFRVLTQVNYSSGENPEGDSGLHFTSGLLNAIIRKDKTFHFYVLVPIKHLEIWKKFLQHQRITLLPIEIETRTHGGDFQFSPEQLFKVFKFRKFEVDCLFLNQPESGAAYLHLFNKLLFHKIPALSYVHWFDTRPVTSKIDIQKPSLLAAICGMLVSEIVGCNSEYGRQKILNQSSYWFNERSISELGNKIRVLPPGIDTHEFEKKRYKREFSDTKRIIVNHRLLNYTGVRNLLSDTFPKLWERRKDFKVIVTNPSKVRLPKSLTNAKWLIMGQFDRTEYIKQLSTSDLVICPHKSTHWSISTLEAIYAGCIPLMNSNTFFPELMNPILFNLNRQTANHIKLNWFYSNNHLIDKISLLLDNIERERGIIKKLRKHIKNQYSWENLSTLWIKTFYEADSNTHTISNTNPSFIKIKKMIEKNGSMSKSEILREFSWGPQSSTLSWTAFRKQLKLMSNDNSNNSEVIYKQRKVVNKV